MHTLGTGSNEGVVGDHIWFAALTVHLTKQVQCKLPPAGLLTGTDQAAVSDHIPLTSSPDLQQIRHTFAATTTTKTKMVVIAAIVTSSGAYTR